MAVSYSSSALHRLGPSLALSASSVGSCRSGESLVARGCQGMMTTRCFASCPTSFPSCRPSAGFHCPPLLQYREGAGRGRRGVISVASSAAEVVLTRERGKNEKLRNALAAEGVLSLELPLIEHREGPDAAELPATLSDKQKHFDWVVVTSPEAAHVFLEGWRAAGRPNLRLAVVGAGTGQVFEENAHKDGSLKVAFTSSKATAKCLASELPKDTNSTAHVLYPASAKAGNDLESGLQERGFDVTRLNTYSTETVQQVDVDVLREALKAPVVTFASPTAVRAWMEVSGGEWRGAAACIGSTSAQAARKAGIREVFCPDSPGIEGWVASVLEALGATAAAAC
eukprot:TRINITY_DN11119_c0_g1_i1.p1 TRINITY_DN11119_c0_g1~~TRINITY_DN11119_c0_g1_i1.p1  ORF type:complete len:366 (+),score=63.81 TRINITY_DN11119_c0_g1_i1:76-1098(+)